jgi:hypothetical protein
MTEDTNTGPRIRSFMWAASPYLNNMKLKNTGRDLFHPPPLSLPDHLARLPPCGYHTMHAPKT